MTEEHTQAEDLIAGLTILHKYTKDIELVATETRLYFHVGDLCGNDMSREDYDALCALDFWRESGVHPHCFEFLC